MKKMGKKFAALALFALVTGRAPADILTPGMDAAESLVEITSLKTQNGFSAQFWMTTDEQIFTSWAKTGEIPGLKPSLELKRNTPIYLALFMANPGVRKVVNAKSKKGNLSSDVTFDLYIVSPGGVLSLATRKRVGWKGAPPSPGLVFLAKDRGVLDFEAIDPLGEYTIVLVVHDNIRKTDMKLTRRLALVD